MPVLAESACRLSGICTREAFVVVEQALREKSGLDLHGVDLVNKALNYEVDKKTGQITKTPLLATGDNNHSGITEINHFGS